MSIKGRRYDELRNSITDIDGVTDVELDEDWIPPHKMAGVLPYDAIVSLTDVDGSRWTKSEFERILEDNEVKFDKILSFESDGEGNHEVFISLATGAEQGITSGEKTA